jgi:hypothetical protein
MSVTILTQNSMMQLGKHARYSDGQTAFRSRVRLRSQARLRVGYKSEHLRQNSLNGLQRFWKSACFDRVAGTRDTALQFRGLEIVNVVLTLGRVVFERRAHPASHSAPTPPERVTGRVAASAALQTFICGKPQ